MGTVYRQYLCYGVSSRRSCVRSQVQYRPLRIPYELYMYEPWQLWLYYNVWYWWWSLHGSRWNMWNRQHQKYRLLRRRRLLNLHDPRSRTPQPAPCHRLGDALSGWTIYPSYYWHLVSLSIIIKIKINCRMLQNKDSSYLWLFVERFIHSVVYMKIHMWCEFVFWI